MQWPQDLPVHAAIFFLPAEEQEWKSQMPKWQLRLLLR